MNANHRRVLIHTVLGISAAATAFLLGARKAVIVVVSGTVAQAGASSPNSSGPGGRPAVDYLPREKALKQWSHDLQMMPTIGRVSPNDVAAWINSQIGLDRRTNPADLQYLLENVAKLPAGMERDKIESHFLSRLCVTDPATALSLVNTYIDGQQERNGLVQNILVRLGWSDQQLGLTELASLPPGQQTQKDYSGFFSAWVQMNEAANAADAATAAAALPAGSERSQALQSVANSWAEYDPQAALNWASGLPPADAAVFGQTLNLASKQDPAFAAQYVDDIQDATVRDQAIQSVARAWALGAGQDPASALNWLDQEATGDTYDTNVRYILSNLAKTDPATAASLAQQVNEPDVRDSVIAAIATNWGGQNPQAALAWLRSLPDTDSGARAAAIQKLTAAANSSP